MTLSPYSAHIEKVVRDLQQRIEEPLTSAKISPPTVEAIDIVHHALAFAHHPRGLQLWRGALWSKKLHPEAEVALRDMLVYLLAAVDRGEVDAVSAICDCLHEILPPTHKLRATLEAAGAP